VTRLLALCADDFGASTAINRGILQLAAGGRLSAVSCMSNMPAWAAGAPLLAGLPPVQQGRVKLGLHFNLTEGRPLSAALARLWPRMPALPRLIALAHLRVLPREALRAELQAQLLAFEQAAGRAPDHIDGHQHVHHLPVLRDLMLDLLAQRPGLRARHTGHVQGAGYALKRVLIAGTGGRWLGRRLEALGRAANTQLFGVYDFIEADYRGLMQRWLAALPLQGGLVFCHPGEAGGDAHDPIAAARVRELAYLGSADFDADLAAAGVRLATAVSAQTSRRG
jgi:predicted glycoside hydrolase/deacetylase ChbG (UPF0249 family)